MNVVYEWQNNLENSLTTANDRDPRKFPLGYFSGGAFVLDSVRVFQWFATIEEVAAWIRDAEPKIAETEDQQDIARYARASEALLQNSSNLEEARKAVAEALGPVLSFDWLGSFEELISGDSEFARDVRIGFWEHDDEDNNEPTSIPAEKVEEFIEFLKSYGI
jgi:hypothetical protein